MKDMLQFTSTFKVKTSQEQYVICHLGIYAITEASPSSPRIREVNWLKNKSHAQPSHPSPSHIQRSTLTESATKHQTAT